MRLPRNIFILEILPTALIIAFCAGLFMACSDLIFDSNNTTGETVADDEIAFKFYVYAQKSAKTRGTGTYNDTYDSTEGDDYENGISDLKAFFYEDGQLLFSLNLTETTDNVFTATVNTGTTQLTTGYEFKGKVVLLANCPDYSPDEGTALSDANTLTFSYSGTGGGKFDDGIPMWGVDSISTTFSSGQTSDLGTIYLLRAVAKITINLDSEASELGYSLKSATLSSYNTSGYCLPLGADTVSATKNLTRDSCIHIPADVTTGTTLSLIAASDTSLILYVPEMEVAGYDSIKQVGGDTVYYTAPYITLTINKGDTTYIKDIYFCSYDSEGESTSNTFNLVRNHLYNYTLSSAELAAVNSVSYWTEQVSSVGWEINDSNLTFTALNGDTTNASEGDVEGVYCLVLYPDWKDKTSNTEVDDGQRGNASYGLTLSPDAQFETGTITWQAYLTNTEYFQFSYSALTSSEKSKMGLSYDAYNVSTGINRESSYGIKVVVNTEKGQWYDTTDDDGNTIEGVRTNALNCEYIVKVDDEDTIRAVYTDLFILATGAGLTTPLNINPKYSGTGAIFTPNRFPGGTKDITYIDDEGTHHIISKNQWIRIYWAWADIGDYNTRKGILTKIMEASDEDEQWLIE